MKNETISSHLLNILTSNLMLDTEEERIKLERFNSLISAVNNGKSSNENIIILKDGRKLSVSVNQII